MSDTGHTAMSDKGLSPDLSYSFSVWQGALSCCFNKVTIWKGFLNQGKDLFGHDINMPIIHIMHSVV